MKRVSSLGAIFLSAACSLDPATTTPETYADYLKLLRQTNCEASLRCCGTVCAPKSDAAFYQPSARVFDYLDAKLIEYNRQAAIDCLNATQQRYASCDASVSDLPPLTVCNNILVPKAGPGGQCETGVNSCAGVSFCSNMSCKIRSRDGESCNTGSSIPICANDTDTCCNVCTGACSAGAIVGQNCSTSAPNSCQVGAVCSSSTLRCVAAPGPGQPCVDLVNPCDARVGLVCAPPGLCVMPQANGQSCANNSHCASGYCLLPNLPQTTGGTCQPVPVPPTIRELLCAP